MKYEQILLNFADNLNNLMNCNNLNVSNLSKETNIARTAILRYTNKKGLPSLKIAIKLADYFNCSLDFLVGLTDRPEFCKVNSKNCFIKNLKKQMDINNVGVSALAAKCGFENSNVAKWAKGAYPSLDILVTLAVFFDCTLETLIGRENF